MATATQKKSGAKGKAANGKASSGGTRGASGRGKSASGKRGPARKAASGNAVRRRKQASGNAVRRRNPTSGYAARRRNPAPEPPFQGVFATLRDALFLLRDFFLSAFDRAAWALEDLFAIYGRNLAIVTLLILALCDFLTLFDYFVGGGPSDGILLGWISVLFRAFLGYGYPFTLPAILIALLILYRNDDEPSAALLATLALLTPVLIGTLAHLILPGASLATGEGVAAFAQSLWDTGLGLASGGVLAGGIAELCRAFFSQPVALILFLAALWAVSARLGVLDRLREFASRPRLGRAPKWEMTEDEEYEEESPPKERARKKSERREKKKRSGDIGEEVEEESERIGRKIARAMSRNYDKSYHSPSIAHLEGESEGKIKEGAKEDKAKVSRQLRETRNRLEDTLKSFEVDATAEGEPVRGPSVTRYEFRLGQGVKLSKITNLADDIALSLGSGGVRIAPIQNKKSVVGIEVPNQEKTPVLLRDMLELKEFTESPSATTFALGKDISGEAIIGRVEDLPHVLIAGTTGSGKSVCMNSMIISLLYKSSPEKLGFIMIDPKMVELAPYNKIPHLLTEDVVTDPRKAAGALQWAVGEMMRRYKLFSENGVKKLSEYQALARKKKGFETLQSVVVVIDELSDLMIAAAKEVEESIIRIAQMGRAAGIHLVIATQRPSADVITGLMKANIPSRIAFAVASAMESRIILDSAGAEKLVGNGDMLYVPLGGEKKRVQGCYVSPEEIEQVVSSIKGETAERPTRTNDKLRAAIEAGVSERSEKEKKKERPEAPEPLERQQDELLPDAVDIVLDTGQASVSMLQRRLKLGYSRAARLVDQMEHRGYVGPFEGSRPRQILISREQWQKLRDGASASD